MDFIIQNFNEFLTFTGFANASAGNLIMILVGALFIWLAIKKDFEPLLLVPIGLGIILGNIPFRADAGLEIGLYKMPCNLILHTIIIWFQVIPAGKFG